jgi:hypothetical protein
MAFTLGALMEPYGLQVANRRRPAMPRLPRRWPVDLPGQSHVAATVRVQETPNRARCRRWGLSGDTPLQSACSDTSSTVGYN